MKDYVGCFGRKGALRDKFYIGLGGGLGVVSMIKSGLLVVIIGS